MVRTFKNRKAAGPDSLLGEWAKIVVVRRWNRGMGRRGESAPPPCATGQMRWCGAPPAMKASEPDPHTWPGPALARRAHTREEKGEKSEDGMDKSTLPFSDKQARNRCLNYREQ
jgi:hypothetical protein